MMKTHLCSRFVFEGPPMTVMKFGRASVQDAQAIDRVAAMIRERGDENLATISASTNMLAPGNDPAPKARSRLAQPEASNAKPEGWVKHKMRLSPVGATQEGPAPRLTANEILSSKFCPTTRQVSGHEFTRATKNCFSQTNRHPELPSMRTRFHQRPNRGEGPCVSSNSSRLPKQKVPRVCSQADESACSLTTLGMTIRFLRAYASPRCQSSSRRVLP